ncbi:GIY-YIG nuclease family protein [Paenibacillus sp. N1-5-1-14]|uniref:GIY-YIG nuclease family protein n=1 Tax=Paenibacillus radicibacter TaxID=2972488 RepID=UPI0021597E81|nr:GIY-YIG nuclease family protein [Paenibacillus radicibacter]MCR8641452.1 GIY-YIG nuclease family protein [Paenibacillus radicibacter]
MTILLNTEWKALIEDLSQTLLNSEPTDLSNRKSIPTTGGVYIFSSIDDKQIIYIGQAGNIRGRVFNSHLYEMRISSFRGALLGLKKNQLHTPVVERNEDLNLYILENYHLRYKEVNDTIIRGCLESYLIGLLKPKYSVPTFKR